VKSRIFLNLATYLTLLTAKKSVIAKKLKICKKFLFIFRSSEKESEQQNKISREESQGFYETNKDIEENHLQASNLASSGNIIRGIKLSILDLNFFSCLNFKN